MVFGLEVMATTQTSESLTRKDDSNTILKNGNNDSIESTANDCYSRVKSPSLPMEQLYGDSVPPTGGVTHVSHSESNSFNYNSNNEDSYRNSHEPQVGQYPPPQHQTNYQNSSDLHASGVVGGGPNNAVNAVNTGPNSGPATQNSGQVSAGQQNAGPPGVSAGQNAESVKSKMSYMQQQTNQLYNRALNASHQPLGPPNPLPPMGPPGRAGGQHIPNSGANYNNNSNNNNNNSNNANVNSNNNNMNSNANNMNNIVRYPGQPVSGPTPTLNQLLQSPNSLQRYQQNSYSEYPSGGPQPQPPNKEHNLTQQQQQAWNTMRFNQQQQQQQQLYRNQMTPMNADKRSPYNMSPYGSPAPPPPIPSQGPQSQPPPGPPYFPQQHPHQRPFSGPPREQMSAAGYPPNSGPPNMYNNPYDQRQIPSQLPQQQQQSYPPSQHQQQHQNINEQDSAQHSTNIHLDDQSSNSSERSTPGKPTTPGPPAGQVRLSNHHSHAGMPPGYVSGNANAPNNAYAYGNHHGFGAMNNNMMPPPSCYPTKTTMPSTSPTGAQAAAQAAVIAAERSANFTVRSPHTSMYLRQHLQQKIYQPNSGSFPPHGPPGMPSMPPGMHSSGPMHGLPPNEPIPPTGSESPSNSGYPLGPSSQMTAPPTTEASGSASTSVTQSITSPLSATPSASLSNSIAEVRLGPQPPPILDEASQASTTSSQAEDSSDTPKHNSKPPGLSHPPTPNTLGSPGAASLSSFHDEFESVSSPSWPRTPASPVVNSQGYEPHGHNVKRPDGLMKLYDMSDEPERRAFLDKLIQYQDERGTPISQCPTISKLPLDLYRLYLAVKERGGFVEVTRAKLWKECTQVCNIATSSSAAYTLRKQYMKHLLPFECKYDRGGIDPQPIMSSLEGANRKKNKNAVPPPEPPFQGHSGGASNMDGYGPGSYPPQPFPPPNAMTNSEYPPQPPSHPQSGYPHHSVQPQMSGPPHMSAQNQQSMQAMANHNESISVKDPFADDIQHGSGYASRNHPPPPSQQPTGHNSYYNSVPQPTGHPNLPPPQNHFGEYNEPFNRQTGQTDPYNAPPAPQPPYPPNRMAHPSNYFNQQQGYDQHRSDNRFEQHTRPPSQDNMYGQQPQQGSAPQQSRGQYPIGPPPGQPSVQHQQNPPQTSNSNYSRGGSSPLGQYGPMGQQIPYNNSNQEAFKNSEISSYQNAMLRIQSPLAQRLLAAKISQSSQSYSGSQQPMYSSGSSSPQQMGGMPSQKSGPTTGANAPPQPPSGPPPQQSATTWHPSSSAQFSQKRHPDFMKQEQHYPPVNNTYGNSQTPMPSSGQYPPYSGTNNSRQTPPNPPTSQPIWNRDNQYRAYGPPSATHIPSNAPTPPFGGPTAPQGMPQGREGWDHMSSRVDNGPNWPQNRFSPSQTGPPVHELYSGPTPYGGSHQINKMSNFSPRNDQNRQFMSMTSNIPPPNKVPPHMLGPTGMHQSLPPMTYSHPQQSHHHPVFHQVKKEIIFPADSVEATTPTLTKRRKLCARDLSSVEAWRLIMCLKSGLLAESTWALDILSVLLHDDSTVLYFGLQHMPGMLEILLEHYKRYLSDIFDGLFDDTEIGYEGKHCNKEGNGFINSQKKTKLWYELNKDLCEAEDVEEDEDEERCSTPKKMNNIPLISEQLILLNTTNYTYKTRDGKPVKFKNGKTLFIVDPDKKWDYMKNGFSGGSDHWSVGGGESTNHIQTHFESDENFVRFVRVIRKRKRNRTSSFSWKMSPTSNECKCQLNCVNDKLATNCSKCIISNNSKFPRETQVFSKENSDLIDNNNNSDKESTKSDENSYPRIRDTDLERYKKRKDREDVEEESYDQDEPAVHVGEDYQDSLTRRCLCLSTLIRNLSFVPGNDGDMSKHSGLLLVLSRLLLLHHSHISKKRHFERSIEDELFAINEDKEKNEKISEKEWWWDLLHSIRENTLVTIANISGQLDLSPYSEQISLPFLDGLLHWAVCPSSYAQDTLPSASYYLSPQRLAFESLSKLSILDSNVDLMLATPPWSRIDKLYQNLARSLSRHEDQTIREFSVVLLSNLSSADSSSARAIALTGCAIPLLISFVEQAEQSALQVANSQGINALRENPELMGTTLDMVRRSASTLRCISRVPDNRPLFLQFQQRLLALVMSQILDQGVAGIIADVIYECSLAVSVINNNVINDNNNNVNIDNNDNNDKNDNIDNDSNENFNENDNSLVTEPEPEPEPEIMTGLDNETSTDSISVNT